VFIVPRQHLIVKELAIYIMGGVFGDLSLHPLGSAGQLETGLFSELKEGSEESVPGSVRIPAKVSVFDAGDKG